MKKSFALTLLLLPALAPSSRACLNDRDTLATEARGVPDVMRALSGRFERNPPLFYQMRMARVARELRSRPARLDLYDDIAVAADRLGRHSEALRWIEQKRVRLQVLPAHNPDVREHWYRYFANAGTFRVHRWIHGGADRKKLGEVKQARALIARAIALKPGAHFGREKYQLKAMDWILKPPSVKKSEDGLPDILGLSQEDYVSEGDLVGRVELKRRGYEDAERGLTGLITLGAAWQSVDVFNALRYVEAWRGDRTVVHLLNLRLQEMARAGRASLHPQAPSPQNLVGAFEPNHAATLMGTSRLHGTEEREASESYKRLRLEADDWHARRTGWMTERLQAGRHPDTDAAFWNGWDDGAPPELEPPTTARQAMIGFLRWLPNVSVLLLSGVAGAFIVRRRRSGRVVA